MTKFITYDPISPVPTVILSTCTYFISKYFNIPLYKLILGCTGTYLTVGIIGAIIIDNLDKNKKDSLRLLSFIIPIGFSFYKIGIFISTILTIHNIKYYSLPYLKDMIQFLS